MYIQAAYDFENKFKFIQRLVRKQYSLKSITCLFEVSWICLDNFSFGNDLDTDLH